MAGYIKLNRSIFEDEMYFADKFTREQAWIDLLLLANYRKSLLTVRGNQVEVARGSLAWSIDKLAARWKWSINRVIRYMTELQKQGKIEVQKSHIINIISVVKYEYYQTDENTEISQKGYADGYAEMGKTKDNNSKNGDTEISQNGTTENQHNAHNNSGISNVSKNNESAENTADGYTDGYTDGYHNKNNKNNKNVKKDKEDDDAKSPFDYQNVVDLYHRLCPAFPKLLKLTSDRKAKITARMSEIKDLCTMDKIFKKMQASAFLKGNNSHHWKASFDWVMENDKNWVKVLEGNYDTTEPSAPRKNLPPVYNNDEVWGSVHE